MSDSLVLIVGVFVFVMALVGLGLTVLEFRYGQPRREELQKRREARRRERHTPQVVLDGVNS